jgi:hypothetical protein
MSGIMSILALLDSVGVTKAELDAAVEEVEGILILWPV